MSFLINHLKMRCNISRIPDNPAKEMDNYGSYVPEFTVIASDVKSYFQYLRMASGKLLLDEAGQQPEDVIIGFIDKNTEVKIGDLIYCSTFYPNNFYIGSVNPIINGRTGVLSHYEVTCNIEKSST